MNTAAVLDSWQEDGPSNEAQEAAFDRELRRKKKKRKGRSL